MRLIRNCFFEAYEDPLEEPFFLSSRKLIAYTRMKGPRPIELILQSMGVSIKVNSYIYE